MTSPLTKLLGLLIIGPTVAMIIIGCAASATVLLSLTGKLDRGWSAVSNAAGDLDEGFGLCLLRGIASAILTAILVVVFFRIHQLALLGIVFLFLWLCLVSAGATAASVTIGDRIQKLQNRQPSKRNSFGYGIWTLLLASSLPAVGWCIAGSAALAGSGAIIAQIIPSLKSRDE